MTDPVLTAYEVAMRERKELIFTLHKVLELVKRQGGHVEATDQAMLRSARRLLAEMVGG